MNDPTSYPVNGILDLHVFNPRDAADVTREYVQACHEKGIYRVRVIHGKGRSVLRARIRKVLENHPLVDSIQNPADRSGWGAVIALLRPGPRPASERPDWRAHVKRNPP